jgi:hypothetical protein
VICHEARSTSLSPESLDALGPSDPFIAAVLKGRRPADVAREAIRGTTLADATARRTLANSGPPGLASTTDPLLILAREADRFARPNEQELDEKVKSIETAASLPCRIDACLSAQNMPPDRASDRAQTLSLGGDVDDRKPVSRRPPSISRS